MTKKIKALIVDDNKIHRESLHKMLERLNCECVKLNYTNQAVEILENQFFDLIFLDIGMPSQYIDGLETVKRLTELGIAPSKIIIFTGRDDSNKKVKMFELGVTKFLIKGKFTSKDVEEIVVNTV